MTNFEQTSGVRITQLLNTNFADFRLGSISVSSYSDAGQDPQYAGSVLAHGISRTMSSSACRFQLCKTLPVG
jgi:hypothetical protein